MKRKLLILDAVLLLVAAYAGFQLRQARLAAQARSAAELGHRLKAIPPPPFTPLPQTPPVVATGYAAIAQQMLFDKSRNPTVVVEQPAPPPPKPMPPLPVYHGQMNIGAGPTAILSETAVSAHQAVHIGDQIGQFKLVDVNTEEIAFEWDGQTIRRKLDAIVDRTSAPPPDAAGAASARTEAPPPAPVVAKSAIGPGSDTGRGFKVCDPNDNMPAGSVVDGYRKVVAATPFGDSCRWDPVGR